MTNREFFSAVLSANISAELNAHATEVLAKLDNASVARKAKASEKRAEENAPIVAQMQILLVGANEPMTAKQIADALGISTSKATALAKSIDNIVIGKNGTSSRAVNTYKVDAE